MTEESEIQALIMSFLVVLVSEIGDKTFLIAAVLAMTNSRLLIFSAAMTALLIMTILSCLLGQVLPALISKQLTELIASSLFLIFGLKMSYDTYKMTGNECLEELNEVTFELLGSDLSKLEEGTNKDLDLLNCCQKYPGISSQWVQAFVMTFMAEWGDRSQLASTTV